MKAIEVGFKNPYLDKQVLWRKNEAMQAMLSISFPWRILLCGLGLCDKKVYL